MSTATLRNCAVVGVAAGLVAAAGPAFATTALFMTGTQSCGWVSMCAAESTFTPAQMQTIANVYPPLFGGATLTAVPTPEVLWPVTGLTSETLARSVAQGTADLNTAIMTTPGQKIVFGGSQSAIIVAQEKQRLLTDPNAPAPGDLQFVVVGNPVRPNGGLLTRFPWVSDIPLIGLGPSTPAPDTPYNTIDIANQYDGIADFPTYPLNLVADANAIAGMYYEHSNVAQYATVTSTPPQAPPVTNSMGGTTTYYLIPTPNLPLLQPLRDLGVPKQIVDPLNAALTPVVEAGYDRNPAHVGVVTPAQLLPKVSLPSTKTTTKPTTLVAGSTSHPKPSLPKPLAKALGALKPTKGV